MTRRRTARTQPNPPGLVFHRATYPARDRGTVTAWTAYHHGHLIGEWSAIGGGWVEGRTVRLLLLREWREATRRLAGLLGTPRQMG